MKKTSTLVQGAIIASAYAALTLFLAPFSFGAIQFRVSEALTVLPFFFAGAVPGLFIGCIIANIFSPFGIIDIIFGSIATLIGAYATYLIGKHIKNRPIAMALAPLPAVISNSLVVGGVLTIMLSNTSDAAPFLFFASQVFVGEITICYFLGLPILFALNKIINKNIS